MTDIQFPEQRKAQNLPTNNAQKGVVAEFLDRGIQDGYEPGTKVHKIVAIIQLEERVTDDDGNEGRRKEVWEWMTLSSDPRSNMVKFYKKVADKDPAPGTSINDCVGVPVFVMLDTSVEGKVKIDSVARYRGPDPLVLDNYTPYNERQRDNNQPRQQSRPAPSPAQASVEVAGPSPSDDDDIPF